MKKYYAVKNGKIPGIYTSWPDCQEQVKGFKGAIFKSFKSLKEAKEFLTDEKIEIKVDKDTVIAYVDGSYKEDDKVYGSAVVYLSEDGQELFNKSYKDEFHKHRNVSGEVKASELAIKKAIEDKKKRIIIYHDYQGIASWANGSWKTNNKLTKSYKDFVEEAREKIQVDFIKVKGHSNDKYNDLADKLAKEAVGIKK